MVDQVTFTECGRLLQSARESKNLSIETVSQALHFSQRQIEALESGKTEAFRNAAAQIGFLNKYARHLRVSLPVLQDTPPPDVNAVPHFKRDWWRDFRVNWWTIGGVLVVILVILVLTLPKHPALTPPQVVPQQVAPTVTTIPPQGDKSEAKVGVEVDQQPQVQTQPAEVKPESAPEKQKHPASTTPPAQTDTVVAQAPDTANTRSLKLDVNEETWISVEDGRQRLLLRKLVPAKSSVTLLGVPPFTVILGRTDQVSIINGDQPVPGVGRGAEAGYSRLVLQ